MFIHFLDICLCVCMCAAAAAALKLPRVIQRRMRGQKEKNWRPTLEHLIIVGLGIIVWGGKCLLLQVMFWENIGFDTSDRHLKSSSKNQFRGEVKVSNWQCNNLPVSYLNISVSTRKVQNNPEIYFLRSGNVDPLKWINLLPMTNSVPAR